MRMRVRLITMTEPVLMSTLNHLGTASILEACMLTSSSNNVLTTRESAANHNDDYLDDASDE